MMSTINPPTPGAAASGAGRPMRVDVRNDKGLKRDIGKIGLLFTGVGSIIGSGWLFGAFNASVMVGPASLISWGLGAVMMIFVALNYAELGVMFPVAGGVIRFPHFSFGSFASFTSGWITWLSVAATVPIEVMAAVQYASSYLPWLMHTVDDVAAWVGRRDQEPGAGGRRPPAGGQRDATAATGGEGAQRDPEHRGAEGGGGAGEAGPGLAVGDLAREQDADRRRDTEPDRAEDLRDHQHDEGAPLHRIGGDPGRRRTAGPCRGCRAGRGHRTAPPSWRFGHHLARTQLVS